ncbi:MAG: ABC transporter ATP-binding protein [Rhabdochlamydiaceae bacterium]|jgi:lipoprotein-releasing system ATP-binding protein
MKKILSAKKIAKRYTSPTPVEVLSDISLDIHEGETVAITGKSGEGKSTLLHILGTLEKPTSGHLEICNINPTPQNVSHLRNKSIGFIFQSFNLLENYTTIENVLMPAKIGRLDTAPKSPAYAHAKALLEEVGLSERANFPAKLLSGGEKQRAAIARAFCNDPDIIFADEPSGNLDHAHSCIIHALLIGSAKKETKLLLSSHTTKNSPLCAIPLITS